MTHRCNILSAGGNLTIMGLFQPKTQKQNMHNSITSQPGRQMTVEDQLDLENIQQLHRVILNFSQQSLEMKKICLTIEIGVLTALLVLYKKTSFVTHAGASNINPLFLQLD